MSFFPPGAVEPSKEDSMRSDALSLTFSSDFSLPTHLRAKSRVWGQGWGYDQGDHGGKAWKQPGGHINTTIMSQITKNKSPSMRAQNLCSIIASISLGCWGQSALHLSSGSQVNVRIHFNVKFIEK